jgi:serine/threonine protein kinase
MEGLVPSQEPSNLAVGAPVNSAHRPGDVLGGRYVLERHLSAGGMGVVWVAKSLALDVDVALKLLHASCSDQEGVERMAREARAAARLGHPAIVRVIDFGETEGGEPFMAMELLEGEALSEVLERQGRLPATEAVGLLLPIIDGLATAHQNGIVHRDVKPENIFIARDEQGRIQPKLVDFGIAKLDREVDHRLTQTGALLGTPQYLSPEQAYGRTEIDSRSDIWSIGVVLYELISGQQPFAGKNYNALIRAITQDAPQPSTELHAGNEQLWRVIERCLQKESENRWGSMWELGEALALWLFEQGVEVDASSRSLRDGWLERGLSGLRMLPLTEKARATEEGGGDATKPPPSRNEPIPQSGPGSRLHGWSSLPTEQRQGSSSSRGTLSKTKKTMLGAFALPLLTYAIWTFEQTRRAETLQTKTETESRMEASLPVNPARTSAATAAVQPIAAASRMGDEEHETPLVAAASPQGTEPRGNLPDAPVNGARVTKAKHRPAAKSAAVDPEFGF